MKPDFPNGKSLLEYAGALGLRQQLIGQIEKDFLRAGLDRPFTVSPNGKPISDSDMLDSLRISICRLLMERFDAYLNLMYAADVPESDFQDIRLEDAVVAASDISLLLLRREWNKVWLRATYADGSADQK
jgi:hypothetical protein